MLCEILDESFRPRAGNAKSGRKIKQAETRICGKLDRRCRAQTKFAKPANWSPWDLAGERTPGFGYWAIVSRREISRGVTRVTLIDTPPPRPLSFRVAE